jgi:hypothetical protein
MAAGCGKCNIEYAVSGASDIGTLAALQRPGQARPGCVGEEDICCERGSISWEQWGAVEDSDLSGRGVPGPLSCSSETQAHRVGIQ